MKKGKYYIWCSWILLVCFVAGQCMVYAHQHQNLRPVKVISKTSPRQTVKEKCDLCDVMHHNVMLTSYQVYLSPVTVARHVYKSFDYNFTSIQLVLAGGRAPPYPQS